MKSVFKFVLGFLVIAGLGAAGILLVRYLGYRGSEEYKVRQELQKIEKQYAEDPYGGDTPEETLRLFIDALKKGDTDLASKYFVLDKQERWRNELLIIKEKGLLDEMVRDLERKKYKHSISDDQITFSIANDENEVALTILLGRGPNNKWKILDL